MSGVRRAKPRAESCFGSGQIGPIGRLVRDRYFDAVRGKLPEYSHWLTAIE